MNPTRLILAALCLSAGLLGGVSSPRAQGLIATTRFYKTVSPGGRIKVTWYVTLDAGCHTLGETRINLVRPPEGGTLETAHGSEYPTFGSSNPRYACNRRKAPATDLYYHAGASFSGIDTFDVEAVSPDGTARKYRYAIVVH